MIEKKTKSIHPCVWPPDWFEDLCQILVLTKFDGSSFFVKSQSVVLNFCHLMSFATDTKETNFSVKLSWEVHWIIMFQKDVSSVYSGEPDVGSSPHQVLAVY